MTEALEFMFRVTNSSGIREDVTEHLDTYNVVEQFVSWSVGCAFEGEPVRQDPVVHVSSRNNDHAIILLGGGAIAIIVIWVKDATTAHKYVAGCHGWGHYRIPKTKLVSVLRFTQYGCENITEEWKD